MAVNKIIGWFLLILGVAIISYTLYYSFGVFTNRISIPEIFTVNQEEERELTGTKQDLQEQAEEIIREQLKEIIPADFLLQLFNLISWSLLSGILIFGGSQIANLGIKLIKN